MSTPTKHLLTGLFLEQFMFIFEGKVEDIHAAHYKDVPEETFRQIVLADPTTLTDPEGLPKKMGNYCKWLLGLFKAGNLPLEDLQKAKNSLTVFAKSLRMLPVEKRDVNKFKSLPDLFDTVAPYEGNKSKGELAREIKSDGATKVYDDGVWTVLVLKTQEAATYYGAGTKWCTAAENGSLFKEYSEKGRIYVNINKTANRKYQFHFESGQFMDETDRPIEPLEVLSPAVVQWYETRSPAANNKKLVKIDGTTVVKFQDHYIRFAYDETMTPIAIYQQRLERFIPSLWSGGFKEGGEVSRVTDYMQVSELLMRLRERKFPYNLMTPEQYSRYQVFLDNPAPGTISNRTVRNVYREDLDTPSPFSKAAYGVHYNALAFLGVEYAEDNYETLKVVDQTVYKEIMASLRQDNKAIFTVVEGEGSVFAKMSSVKELVTKKAFTSFFPKMTPETVVQYGEKVPFDDAS